MDFMNSLVMGSQSGHSVQLAETLNKQREEQSELCDVTININGKEIKAHWCVLVSCPFFESMYSSGLTEKNTGKVNILIGKTYAVEKILTYLYQGKIQLSMQEMEDILEVADYLQCLDVKQYCNNFLARFVLETNNCVRICLISSLYDLPIQERVMRFMKGHLPEVFQGEDILTLTLDSVLSLLKDDTLSYVSKDVFAKFLVRWIKHDMDGRGREAIHLFECLNIEKLSSESLVMLLSDDKMCKLLPVGDLNTALERYDVLKNYRKAPRDIILMGGGVALSDEIRLSLDTLYAFNLVEERWTELWRLPCPIKRPLIGVSEDNLIYVIDKDPKYNFDYYGNDKLYTLYAFDIACKVWKMIRLTGDEKLADYRLHDLLVCKNRVFLLGVNHNFPRVQHKCCLIEVDEDGIVENHFLFDCDIIDNFYGRSIDENRIGIVRESSRSKKFSIKVYKLDSKTLTEPSRAKSCLSTLSHTKIFSQDKTIVQFDILKKTIRKFNSDDNLWSSFPRMTTPPITLDNSAMYSFYKDQLYIFGGETSTKSYKYICDRREWVQLDDMPSNNFLSSSATCNAKLSADLVSCHLKCPHCYYSPKCRDVAYPDLDSPLGSPDPSYVDSDYYDEDAYDWNNDYDDEDEYMDRNSNCSLM